MKKLLFIVLDGAADLPIAKLGGKTPLEVANKPFLNSLARRGINGIMTVMPIAPESDEAVISLLGYDVFDVYTGRGPLEAIGGGAKFRDGNVAVRCNFATQEDGFVQDVRAGRINTDEARQLEWAINEFVKLTNARFSFKSTAGYRSVLVLRSKGKLSGAISNTHPGYVLEHIETAKDKGVPLSAALIHPDMKLKKCVPLIKGVKAGFTANLVNEFIQKSSMVLEKHPVNLNRISKGLKPANILLTRDAGDKIPNLYSFTKTYGQKWACIADMPVERGIAQLSDMQVIPVPESSGDLEADMSLRAETVVRNINLYDAIYIHLKGPDIFAHIGDVEGKIKSFEIIDKYFFEPLIKRIDRQNTIVVVTCDHTTSTEHAAHTADPVPVTIFGPGIVPDKVPGFWEDAVKHGSLKYFKASDLMPLVVKFTRR